MLELLKNTDKNFFLYLNGMHCSFCDVVMPYLTSFWLWIPLFAWWLYKIYTKHHKRTAIIVVFVTVLIIASDQGSVLIKRSVKRYRPTHNTEIGSKVHTVDGYRGGEYGFVSSHAANSFAIATFLFLLMKPRKLFALSLVIYVCLVCYSRIYLGVHYPLDILGGALLGSTLAFVIYKIYHKFFA
jgi:undecaprenyl-diphosphatase